MKLFGLVVCVIGSTLVGVSAFAKKDHPLRGDAAQVAPGFDSFEPQGRTPAWSRGIQNLSISFDECSGRARRALEAEGFTVEKGGGSFSGDQYFGGQKDGYSAVIACNTSPTGSAWANVFVGSFSSGDVAGQQRQRLQAHMERAGTGSGTLVTGTYRVDTSAGGINHPSTWRLEVSGNQITGVSEWNCCPGPRTDPMRGRIEGNRVIIERDCGGKGFDGSCSQVYEGTIQGNSISGSFSGTGASNATWTLHLR